MKAKNDETIRALEALQRARRTAHRQAALAGHRLAVWQDGGLAMLDPEREATRGQVCEDSAPFDPDTEKDA